MESSPQKPLLIYDGDCGFCRHWVERWRYKTADRVDYAPYQSKADEIPEIPRIDFQSSVQFLEPGNRRSQGAEAVFRLLAYRPRMRWLLWLYQRLPGFAGISEAGYRSVAAHRPFFSSLTRLLWGKSPAPSTYFLTRRIFFALLGLVYLIAFASLGVQIKGLVGSNGISPARELLREISVPSGAARYYWLPTLFWISSQDWVLLLVCGLGAALSFALILGYCPAPLLFFLWLFYLSLFKVGGVFLSFQWDILLLETGFLAIFFAPWALSLKRAEASPSRAILLLLRWLLFRLMVLSGLVKLLSGDPSWRDGSALQYHYETQPLPNWVSYYAHQLPLWFQRLSLQGMFFVELLVPFLIFAPRRPRRWAAYFLIVFQILIMMTGNYGFFNLLTIALCTLLLDDESWPGWIRRRFSLAKTDSRSAQGGAWPQWILLPLGLWIFLSSLAPALMRLREGSEVPEVLEKIYEVTEPFHLTNSYGLFAVMTKIRPEIRIEGSLDGQTWSAYEFRWKPGALNEAPRFVEPHMPRLDWQMWFAALSSYRHNPWFHRFLQKLLEGSPDVLALLKTNPFPGQTPHYLRATISRYQFSDLATKAKTGDWWVKGEDFPYSPTLPAELP